MEMTQVWEDVLAVIYQCKYLESSYVHLCTVCLKVLESA